MGGCLSGLIPNPGLEEGTYYRIIPKVAQSKCLGCGGKGTTNGTPIVLWDQIATKDQEWTVKKLMVPNTYHLIPGHCKLQLDIPDTDKQAHLWEATEGPMPNKNQVFAFVPVQDEEGWWFITRPEGKLTLDVSGGRTDNGTEIVGWHDFHKGDNQKFKFVAVPKLDTAAKYHIIPRHAENKVFGVAGRSAENGTPIILWDNDGDANQHWTPFDHGGGYYSFAPGHAPGQRLDNPAVQQQCHIWDTFGAGGEANPNQVWQLVDAGAGYYHLLAAGGRVLDVKESGTENGAIVYTWADFHKGPNQQFKFVRVQ